MTVVLQSIPTLMKENMNIQYDRYYRNIKRSPVKVQKKTSLKRGRKGKWSKDEDNTLLRSVNAYIQLNQVIDYKAIAKQITHRNPKQCKERYENSLKPDVKTGKWSNDETIRLAELICKYGQNWTLITAEFKDRTYNGIKKRGMKILGEILDRNCIAPGSRGKLGTNWTKKEQEKLLSLHKEFRYDLDKIAYIMKGRTNADLDRQLLKTCKCQTCTRRFKALCISCNSESSTAFKEAWSRAKAEKVYAKLLEQQRKDKLNMSFTLDKPVKEELAINNSIDLLFQQTLEDNVIQEFALPTVMDYDCEYNCDDDTGLELFEDLEFNLEVDSSEEHLLDYIISSEKSALLIA